MPVIGFLSVRSPGESASVEDAFRKGLSEAGYVEGQNVHIAFRWAEGRYDRLPSLAADLVSRQVAVIAALSSPAALAAKAATSTIPVVFNVGVDPVRAGLVSSLNRPGGNVTGATFLAPALEPKRLGLLRELIPQAELVAVLRNPNYPDAEVQLKDVHDATRAIGQQTLILTATTDTEIDTAFATMAQERVGALMVFADPFFDVRRERIVALATRHRVPAIYHWREYVVVGGLLSYGASPYALISRGRRLRRQDFERNQAGRLAGDAAYEIRTGYQPQDRQGVWPRNSADPARARRRGDRVNCPHAFGRPWRMKSI
jgi:putative ABC transport system substrate-binding protein